MVDDVIQILFVESANPISRQFAIRVSAVNDDSVLMEIKVLHNMPLWLTDILTRGHIKKGSISKYGKAYTLEREKALSYRKGGN